MEKILITGCSGFLASYLTKKLSSDKTEILGITEEDFSSEKYRVIKADIRDRTGIENIIREFTPDKIYHLAAISNVGFSWKNPGLTYEVNFIGSSNILESAAKYSPSARIILMSSAEVYSGVTGGLLKEDSKTSPDNPYALSKLAMEMAADLYINSKNMDIIKIRSFNFTGPGQNVSFVSSDFAAQVALIEKGKRDPVIKVGNLSAERDFSDVRDIARFLSVLGREGKSGETYNLCSGRAYSISDMLNTLLELSDSNIRVEVEKERYRPVDKPLLAGDNSKIRNELGLVPQYDIKQTLSDLLEFSRNSI
ncbi:MAG: GDP-mannose 4,6-dehydratase [Acidobacteriota bacterium]